MVMGGQVVCRFRYRQFVWFEYKLIHKFTSLLPINRPQHMALSSTSKILQYKLPLFIAGVLTIAAFPPLRHAFVYNFIPLTALCTLVLWACHRFSTRAAVTGILVLSAVLHLMHIMIHGVTIGFDSGEYIEYARAFAAGEGFPGMIYRPPGYPFFAGSIFYISGNSLTALVCIQHCLVIATTALLYYLCRLWQFDRITAACAMMLFACSSLPMQMAAQIMSETLFMFGICVTAVLCSHLLKRPGAATALWAGLWAGAVQHIRQLILPFYGMVQILHLAVHKQKALKNVIMGLCVFFLTTIAWSFRNSRQFDTFSLSEHLGANIFTKASAYGLIDTGAHYFSHLRIPYRHVLNDLDISYEDTVSVPEENWNLIEIPHVLYDTLRAREYGYARISDMLSTASLHAFADRPLRYCKSVADAFRTLLWEHHDLYPDVNHIVPGISSLLPHQSIRRILRGAVYTGGWIFTAAFLFVCLYPKKRRTHFAPFAVICGAYGITSLVQVGFTRYTTPWVPYLSICSAMLCTYSARLVSDALRRLYSACCSHTRS